MNVHFSSLVFYFSGSCAKAPIPQAPAAPAAASSGSFSRVTPPIAQTGTGERRHTSWSSVTPLGAKFGLQAVV